jgi:integrase
VVAIRPIAASRHRKKSVKTRRSTRRLRLLAPVWDALRKIDTLTRQRKAEMVDVIERDNKTLRQHKLHFVFLHSKEACHM